MSIRTRLLLLSLLVALLAASFVSRRFVQERDREITGATSRLAAMAAGVTEGLGERIQGTKQLHFGLARAHDLNTRDRPACSAFLSQVLDKHPQYTGILTIDPDGQLFCDSLRTGRTLDLTDRDYFKRAILAHDTVVMQPAFGRLSHLPVLQIASPVRTDAGKLKFVLLASLDLQQLAQARLQNGLMSGAEVLLVDHSGIVLASAGGSASERRPGASIAGSPLMRLAGQASGARFGELPNRDGPLHVWAVADPRSVPEAAIHVLVGYPKEQLVAAANRRLIEAIATLAAAAMVAFGGIWLFVDLTIRRPIATIAEMVTKLGNNESGARIPGPHPRGELGVLMELLNKSAEAQQAQRATVQRSQRQLRLLIDGLGSDIYVGLLTPDGILVEANHSPLKAAGLKAEDVLGKPFADTPWWRGSPQVQQQLRDAIARAAAGESSQYEVRIRGANDEEIALDFSIQPLRDETGAVIFLVPSAIDITERKRAEAARRKSESEFRALAESMPQIVWMAHSDGMNIYCNQRWTDYTGLTLAESTGHGWNKPFHPEDQQRASDAWQLAVTTISAYMLECRLRRADGEYRWWLLRGVPLRDADGGVSKWVGTCTDIHELKLAELKVSHANQELEQQRTELRVLFDLMPALVMFKDAENRIVRINRQGAEAAGASISQIEGRSARDIYLEDGPQGHLADLEVIRTGEPKLGTVSMIHDLHGKELWVQRDRVPYRDASGKVIGIVVMAQDITQRKRDQDALRELNADLEARVAQRTAELTLARSQAEEASRAKSDFLAAMSHEIRTPMSGMLSLLELLELSPLDKDQHSTLGLARESGMALVSIINDILDFSRIEANRLDLSFEAGSIKSIVENAGALQASIASRKDVKLRISVDPAISPLLALDPLRLGQILHNLLGNAVKFTERGAVELTADLIARRQEIEELRFVVRDTGIGMSTQQVGRLFQPFVQASEETSNKFGGSGLGLVIARRLAELMGGTLEIESELGRGTTVTLTLAFEACDSGARRKPAIGNRRDMLSALVADRRPTPSIEEAAAEGTLLLVVDDHPTNRRVLVQQAASLGYAAEAAADGVQALALWRSGRYGAVVTDCNMPRMNGYELAAEIRGIEQHGGLRRVPIIGCTANALQSAADSCIGAGMDDCIVKPADLAKVSEMLARWLPLPDARRCADAGIALPAAGPLQGGTTGAEGLLDTALLADISGGNAAVRAQILADFRQSNEVDAAALRQAAGERRFSPVMELSHRIKGATLMLGATRLSQACGHLEAAGAACDPADVLHAMGIFETELLRLNNYLETLI